MPIDCMWHAISSFPIVEIEVHFDHRFTRKTFRTGNLKILSIPGAIINDVYNFVSPINQYCKLLLFIGGKDLYNGCKPSDKTPIDITNQLIELANFLTEGTKELFLIGIPDRIENKERSAAVNDVLAKVSHRICSHKPQVNWKYRGIS